MFRLNLIYFTHKGQIKRLSQENGTRLQIPPDAGENTGLYNRGNTSSAMFEFSNGSPHGVVGHVRKAASAVDRFRQVTLLVRGIASPSCFSKQAFVAYLL